MIAAALQPASDRELLIQRVLSAPRPLVFKMWTQPEHVVRWWGPKDWTSPAAKMDVRPGGAYRVCIRSPEGTELWIDGVFQEVIEPERLVFTFRWDSDEPIVPKHQTIVTIDFEERGGKTLLTFHQGMFDVVEDRDSHHSGWSGCLDKLEALLA
jgi:uncharacterized protein YndB with AHSA1/START domain